ncbi:c-type cytochrome, methanol metabolism-related [Breoghania sp.]|uniref:c-type cytochrome, methanol metabolism-related n=1 Tax=Breoghania sp. TaxID=2065378 RepID=UPI00374A956D
MSFGHDRERGIRRRSRWVSGLAALAVSAVMAGNAMAQDASTDDWEQKPYIIKDGKVDYGVYNGFRRYHASCHVCHGPDGLGSSYAPALVESLKTMSYSDFLEVVVNGRQVVNASSDSVMPSFAEVPDVMFYIDHIYAYLKARSNDEVGRGRPKRLPAGEDPVFKEWKASQ